MRVISGRIWGILIVLIHEVRGESSVPPWPDRCRVCVWGGGGVCLGAKNTVGVFKGHMGYLSGGGGGGAVDSQRNKRMRIERVISVTDPEGQAYAVQLFSPNEINQR